MYTYMHTYIRCVYLPARGGLHSLSMCVYVCVCVRVRVRVCVWNGSIQFEIAPILRQEADQVGPGAGARGQSVGRGERRRKHLCSPASQSSWRTVDSELMSSLPSL